MLSQLPKLLGMSVTGGSLVNTATGTAQAVAQGGINPLGFAVRRRHHRRHRRLPLPAVEAPRCAARRRGSHGADGGPGPDDGAPHRGCPAPGPAGSRPRRHQRGGRPRPARPGGRHRPDRLCRYLGALQELRGPERRPGRREPGNGCPRRGERGQRPLWRVSDLRQHVAHADRRRGRRQEPPERSRCRRPGGAVHDCGAGADDVPSLQRAGRRRDGGRGVDPRREDAPSGC